MAIYHPKGGVGKTTASFNICKYLSRLGKSTLLIDNDEFYNLSHFVNFVFKENEFKYKKFLNNEISIEKIIKKKLLKKIHFLSFSLLKILNIDSPENLIERLNAILSTLKINYDFVIIDFGDKKLVKNNLFLKEVDKYLIPVICDDLNSFTFDFLLKELEEINKLKLENKKKFVDGFFFNFFDYKNKGVITKQQEILKNYKEYFYKNLISYKKSYSLNFCDDISNFKKISTKKIEIEYYELAKEIAAKRQNN